jgi:hypothetical protein
MIPHQLNYLFSIKDIFFKLYLCPADYTDKRRNEKKSAKTAGGKKVSRR